MPKNAGIFLVTLIAIALFFALALGYNATTVAQTIIRNPRQPVTLKPWCGNGCSSTDTGIDCTDWTPAVEGSVCQAKAICSKGCTVWEASSTSLGSFLPPACASSRSFIVPRNRIRRTIR